MNVITAPCLPEDQCKPVDRLRMAVRAASDMFHAVARMVEVNIDVLC